MTKFMEVNMFNMKKLIAVTIVSACMLSPLTSACAETITDESPCELPLYYKQYIEECLPIYLNNTDFVGSEITYSSLIPLYEYNSEDVCAYYTIIFSGDTAIGKLEINEDNGTPVSVFDTNITKEFEYSINSDSKYAFISYNRNIYLQEDVGDVIWVDGNDESLTYDVSKSFPLEEFKIAGSVNMDDSVMELSSEGASLGSINLPVSHVGNVNVGTSTNKKYVCWAACVAMTANYMDGDSYTARDVYNKVKSSYSGSELGSPSCISDAYSKCVDTSFSYRGKAIKADTVFTSLRKGAPVQIAINGKNQSNVATYHAILITGLHLYSNKAVYTVDDPDYKSGSRSFIAVGAPTENISSISYLGMDGDGLTMTYDDWYRSHYVG